MKLFSTPENLEIIDALTARMAAMQPGETLKNADIENMVHGKRHLLIRARAILNREHGYIFASVYGVGIKRIDRDAIPLVGEHSRFKAMRGLGRAKKQIIGVIKNDGENLSEQQKLRCSAELAKLGLAAQFLV